MRIPNLAIAAYRQLLFVLSKAAVKLSKVSVDPLLACLSNDWRLVNTCPVVDLLRNAIRKRNAMRKDHHCV